MEVLLRGGFPDGGPDRDGGLPVLLREGFLLARGLLSFYGLEVTHLKPNSITQITIFILLCEAYLGIAPHFNLWRALYHLKWYPINAPHNVVGGTTFSLS